MSLLLALQAAGGGVTASPGEGALVATGYAPVIVVSNNQAVSAGVGVGTLAGQAPVVVASSNQTVAAGVGVLVATGLAPSLAVSDHQRASPDTGVLEAVGYAPSVSVSGGVDVEVSPDVGELVATGHAPSVEIISASKTVEPGTGLLIVTGYAPTVQGDPVVAPPASEGGILVVHLPPTGPERRVTADVFEGAQGKLESREELRPTETQREKEGPASVPPIEPESIPSPDEGDEEGEAPSVAPWLTPREPEPISPAEVDAILAGESVEEEEMVELLALIGPYLIAQSEGASMTLVVIES